jgi:hypothetical protein
VTGSGVIESPAKVLEMWTLEAEAHHAQGSCFVLTNHPFISGRPSKAVALERLMERVKGMDGMWVATMEEIAEHTRRTVQEVHTHARIEVPSFPDTGAKFTPAAVRESGQPPPAEPPGRRNKEQPQQRTVEWYGTLGRCSTTPLAFKNPCCRDLPQPRQARIRRRTPCRFVSFQDAP